jgi:hypothetical protein
VDTRAQTTDRYRDRGAKYGFPDGLSTNKIESTPCIVKSQIVYQKHAPRAVNEKERGSKDEEDRLRFDSLVSKLDFTAKTFYLSFYPYLFTVWLHCH